MTVPGGAFGESPHDDEANPPAAGEPAPEHTPWEPPAADYPPPAYPPPGYSPDYPAGHPSGYPEPIGPTGYTPPGYQQPSGYVGSPYPPGPPPFGPPPAGYGPPGGAGYPGGYPGSYYPASDYLGPSQPRTNAMAIASLISSFAGLLCGMGSIVAIVLGSIALNQVKRTREEGYGLAVAGIVIGVLGLLAWLIIAIYSAQSR